MALTPGTRLGPYEIVSPIGAGGMGEVYRAKDTRLDRSVAIKVLPSHLSSDAQFRERFDREARAVSALNHPNICILHDVGHEQDVAWIVMELLEGETLEDRLVKGPLPIGQVLHHGIQIASGLDKAHRQGIVHRDLKPGNIMLTKAGAKLLDFGLAKSAGLASPMSGTAFTGATAQKPLTQEGTILGTFQYMAPEQLEGEEAGARTDIFALGAVLYEMAAGRRAFEGKTKTSLIAAIVSSQPRPLSQLEPLTPPALEHVIVKCLEKDPDDRWQSAHDIAEELRWISQAGSQTGIAAPLAMRRKKRERLFAALAAGGVLTSIVLGYALWSQHAKPERVIRSSIVAPPAVAFLLAEDDASALSISPDGSYLTFSAAGADGKQMLWLRALDTGEARTISGSERGTSPFWSPDGRSIAFFAGGKLKRADVSGGPAVTIAEARNGRGGTWGSDGTIVFEPHWQEPLSRVPASGGKPALVTKLDAEEQETTHRWPWFLPDGRHFLYLAGSHLTPGDSDVNAIYIGSLDSQERTLLLRARSNAVYVQGYVLFVRENYLMAQPFDSKKRKLTGDPIRLAENVTTVPGFFRALFAASSEGTLAYFTGPARGETQLKWIDRNGKELSKLATHDAAYLRFSPDGSRVIISAGDPADLWVLDVARGSSTRFTSHPMGEFAPVWSPDGSRIVFTSDRNKRQQLFEKPVDGLTKERLLLELPNKHCDSGDWSRDGKYLVVEVRDLSSEKGDIWILPVGGEAKPAPFIETEFDERRPLFSPDAQWLTFVSDESGRDEVYAVRFPGRGEKRQLSAGGGDYHRFRADGREIVYVSPDGTLMSVAVDGGTFGDPEAILKLSAQIWDFDITRDGSRFLVAERQKIDASPITLVTNWTGAFRAGSPR